MEYATLAELKTYLGITGTAEDTALSALITDGTALVDIELGDNLGTATLTRRIDGSGEARIIMENNINSVTSVTDVNTGYVYTVDFISGRIITLTEKTLKGRKNLSIVYTKWYATVPSDMHRFFLSYCRELYNMAGTSELEQVKTQSLGGGLSLTYFSPSELQGRMVDLHSVIEKYKNFNIT